MIKLENVNKYFYRHKKNEIHVIDNTTVEFGKNGLVALLGQSGCGKTTLLNAIGGLDKVNKGKIYIDGKRITKKRSSTVDRIRNLNIGYIFQDYYLVDSMSVYDNVALALKINGIKNKEEIKKRVNYVLEKVGMYRYRNRYANMLSGGERQRVGIARAIVKDPQIIIADEPTGNLDSKNSLAVMNIIKAISRDRLVILVTHERELAEFYASRILEIEDGKIKNDKNNSHTNDLDYKIDNKIYLKDFKTQEKIDNKNIDINYYSDTKENIKLNIIVQNGNIYIESPTKVEVVDEDSSIEIVDDHYQKISKSIYEEYDFDFDKIINKKMKPKYSSIFNPLTLLINGFKKIRDYSAMKKLLLFGFLASGLLITYSACSIFGILNIEDKDFVGKNKNYLDVNLNKISVTEYVSYEKEDIVNYILPTDSSVSFELKFNDYYQTNNISEKLTGSLSSINMISKNDLILGNMPTNKHELVIDKMIYDDTDSRGSLKQAGIIQIEDLIGREITIDNMENFIITGISDLSSPSIYTYESEFINIIANSTQDYYNKYEYMGVAVDSMAYEPGTESQVLDYKLVRKDLKLKKGRWPKNSYEVVLNYSEKDMYKIGKKINVKVNGRKLKVVGFYSSKKDIQKYLVSNNTVKYDLISKASNLTIYSKDKETALNIFKEKKLNITDSYERAKTLYNEDRADGVKSCITFCAIVLFISLIEIYLMVRASFLSRIKEVGIFRAIGMKKIDIYKIFAGEIIAISTIGSLSGVILMSYAVNELVKINYFKDRLIINWYIILLVIAFIYVFNLLVGLLPVFRTIRKTPAQILSRSDI